MSEILTRDEFDELVGKLEDELRESISCKAAEVYYRKKDLSDARDAILAAFDAQAERVVELEAERDAAVAAHNVLRDKADVAITRVEDKFDRLQERVHDLVDSGRYKQERIAELEAALCAFAPNNIKPGHWARPIGLLGGEGYPKWKCRHCDDQADEWQDIEHIYDCPIVVAGELLPEETT